MKRPGGGFVTNKYTIELPCTLVFETEKEWPDVEVNDLKIEGNISYEIKIMFNDFKDSALVATDAALRAMLLIDVAVAAAGFAFSGAAAAARFAFGRAFTTRALWAESPDLWSLLRSLKPVGITF